MVEQNPPSECNLSPRLLCPWEYEVSCVWNNAQRIFGNSIAWYGKWTIYSLLEDICYCIFRHYLTFCYFNELFRAPQQLGFDMATPNENCCWCGSVNLCHGCVYCLAFPSFFQSSLTCGFVDYLGDWNFFMNAAVLRWCTEISSHQAFFLMQTSMQR